MKIVSPGDCLYLDKELVNEFKIKECPFCLKNDDLFIEAKCSDITSWGGAIFVKCNNSDCGCEGPNANNEKESINLWNERKK